MFARRKCPCPARRRSIMTSRASRLHRSNASTSTNSSTGICAPVKVVLRVRPLLEREMNTAGELCIQVVDERKLIFDPVPAFEDPDSLQRPIGDNAKVKKNMEFSFENIFGPICSNIDVYNSAIKDIVSNVIDGFNCSVFAYGSTGSGKTFTMLGKQDEPGITFQLMSDLYKALDSTENLEFVINGSYLEIYNENVRDLLNQKSKDLCLREDGREIVVSGLSWFRPENAEQLMEKLRLGNSRRTQHPTDANAESSRSHAVFQVRLKLIRKNEEGEVTSKTFVKLNMIDLAGSERAAANNNSSLRLLEGAKINKSLLALGKCISALAFGRRHIPYRDSKLTRLLKGTLGGNCKTVMIANVSPSTLSYEDTYNTLKYATRAKTIINQVSKSIGNLPSVAIRKLNSDLDEAKKEIASLTAENLNLREKISALESKSDGISLVCLQKTARKLSLLVAAKQEEAKSIDMKKNIELHLQEMQDRFDDKKMKLDRLKIIAPHLIEPEGLQKAEEQRALKCSSLTKELETACRELEVKRGFAHRLEKELEQWLKSLCKPYQQIFETFHRLLEYEAQPDLVDCTVEKNHYHRTMERIAAEKLQLHNFLKMAYLQSQNKSSLEIQELINHNDVSQLLADDQKEWDAIKGLMSHQEGANALPSEAFLVKNTPSTRTRGTQRNEGNHTPVKFSFDEGDPLLFSPAPFSLKNTPSRQPKIFTLDNCTPPANSE
ncbi:kinesin-like protein KIF18B [Neocloeon triangulifer]|uniref:kinesin-like protein KIF18B n=1 Tax=Neocloeon triangulifer TaxID=2078957 RepID=UPI00286FA6BD|nr:kinesin-like protein KIF18B [Neocloeon triangulifer]